MIKVIKKDGTKEEFNVQKVVVAVNKSAYRALVTFTEEELDFICNFVTEKVEQMRKKEVTISDMHNVVEAPMTRKMPSIPMSRMGSVVSQESRFSSSMMVSSFFTRPAVSGSGRLRSPRRSGLRR